MARQGRREAQTQRWLHEERMARWQAEIDAEAAKSREAWFRAQMWAGNPADLEEE